MLFVFSGTGNSYSVARRVADETGNKLIDLAAAVRYKRYTYDAEGKDIGFVYPTYYYGLPRMVLEFVKNVKIVNPGRVYCIATCGGESGGACEMLCEEISDRLKVDACYDVFMPDNAIFYEDAPDEEEQKRMLSTAEDEVTRIIASIKNGDSGDMCIHKGEGTENWRELYTKYDEMRVTEPFVVTDACIECRVCEDVCPERVIKVYHRKPVWDEEKCSMCMTCLQLCPKQAIEFGKSSVGRRRYYHPIMYERTLGIPLRYD